MKTFLFLLSLFLFGCQASKQMQSDPTPEIVRLMNVSAEDWNRSDLDRFMSIYDTAATFMTGKGPVGITATRENYEKAFFKDGKVVQQLRFEELVVRPLGNEHALVTGKFVLYILLLLYPKK